MCSMAGPDETAKCYRCGELKPADAFAWRRKGKGQRDTFCRPCRSAYGKEHYAANRARYIEQARVQKERLRMERTLFLLEYFRANPCIDCGESDPVVLEFDHLRDKLFDVGAALSTRAWPSILAEIESARSSARTAIGGEPPVAGARCVCS
jgi:hypothetical protein